MSKAEAQRIHARRRFHQRFRIEFTMELHHDIVEMIRHNDRRARFVKRKSLRVSLWEVEVSDFRYRIAYDRKRGTIVTVLPDPSLPFAFLGDFWPTITSRSQSD
jgi:hypothetical protein